MTNTQIKQFVKLWSAEYQLTVEINDLESKLECAEAMDRPTKALKGKLKRGYAKQEKILDKIADGIESGIYPENAVRLASKQLGDLEGYAGDCYACLYSDYMLTQRL